MPSKRTKTAELILKMPIIGTFIYHLLTSKKVIRENFEERVRCDVETINKIIAVGKLYKAKERQRQDKELLQTREEREKNSGQKNKEKDKKKEDRTREGGGRSRSSR